jgi:predicted cobalt transporter CbtA
MPGIAPVIGITREIAGITTISAMASIASHVTYRREDLRRITTLPNHAETSAPVILPAHQAAGAINVAMRREVYEAVESVRYGQHTRIAAVTAATHRKCRETARGKDGTEQSFQITDKKLTAGTTACLA